MQKILGGALASTLAISSAAALDSRQMQLFKANALEECLNKANAALNRENTGNVPPNAQGLILRACTCSVDFLARAVTQDELVAAGDGRPSPSLIAKMVQAFKYCRPPKPPPTRS